MKNLKKLSLILALIVFSFSFSQEGGGQEDDGFGGVGEANPPSEPCEVCCDGDIYVFPNLLDPTSPIVICI